MESVGVLGTWVRGVVAGMICTSIVEVHWGWGQGPGVAGPGTSWDSVGLEKGYSGQNLGGDTVLLQVTRLFRCVPWA